MTTVRSAKSANPSSSKGDINAILKEVLKSYQRQHFNVGLPAKVIDYDRDKNIGTVQPLISIRLKDGRFIDRPLVQMPFYIAGGGGFFISFPVVKNDLGWIKPQDRDLTQFLKTYSKSLPQTTRLNDYGDSYFKPDIMTNYEIAPSDENALVIQNRDGSIKISLNESLITIKAPQTIIEGNLMVTGDTDLGAGGSPIARVGDTVAGGVITSGSTGNTSA